MSLPDCWGFGSPDLILGQPPALGEFYDWGFGDPEPPSWSGKPVDMGFGDPPAPAQQIVPYIVPIKPDQVFGDDGGDVVTLEGTWSKALPPGKNGPYRVRLIDAAGQFWPDAAGCYSGVSGAGSACETNDSQSKLRFGLPPLPPGIYTIDVAWGPDFSDSVTLPLGLRVILRGRNLHVYSMRRQVFPAPLNAGPASLDVDRRVGLPEGV